VVEALSRRIFLLSTLEAKLFGLEFLKEMYPHNSKFAEILLLAQMLAPMGILGTMVIYLKRKYCMYLSVLLGIF